MRKESCHKWSNNLLIALTSDSLADIPLTHITKLKLVRSDLKDSLILKVTAKQCSLFQMPRKNAVALFSAVVWAKLATLNVFTALEQIFGGEIKGGILKKSEFLKGWRGRCAVLSKGRGLETFKDKKDRA
jgi:hypothetical protein